MARLAVVRQRYNPYGGAERFVARALPALERAGAEVTLISRSAARLGRAAHRCASIRSTSATCGATGPSPARRARAWRREALRRRAVARAHPRLRRLPRRRRRASRAGSSCAAPPPGRSSAWASRSIPITAMSARAEKRMFEHPRLRAVICNSRMVRDEIKRGFRVAPREAARHLQRRRPRAFPPAPARKPARRGARRARLRCRATRCFSSSARASRARASDAAIDALAQAANDSFWLLVVGQDREERRFTEQAQRAGLGKRVRFLGGARGRAAALCGRGLLYPSEPLRSLSEHGARGAGDGPAGNRRARAAARRRWSSTAREAGSAIPTMSRESPA